MFQFDKYKLDPGDSNTHSTNLSNLILRLEAPNLDDKVNKIKTSNNDSTSDEDVLIKRTLNSFLKRQNVRSFMEIDAGKCCNTVKWVSSQSFSILSLSPYGMPHINCVFILTYVSPKSKNTGDSSSRKYLDEPAGRQTNHGSTMMSQAPSLNSKSDYPPTTLADRVGARSMLTPDLEEELRVIFK
jgi:hypothetical protein